MVEKFLVKCRECNATLGESATSKVELPSQCEFCGSRKLGVVPVEEEEFSDKTFEVVIFNKKSGVLKVVNFIIPKTTFKQHGNNIREMRSRFATELAQAIHQIVAKDELLGALLK